MPLIAFFKISHWFVISRCYFPFWNIRMSTLITIIITYWLLIITIIGKSRNNHCRVGVMDLWLISLLILIECFLCNSYPCALWELITCDWPGITCLFVKFGENLPPQNFIKVNSVNLSQISLLNVWLLVQISLKSAYYLRRQKKYITFFSFFSYEVSIPGIFKNHFLVDRSIRIIVMFILSSDDHCLLDFSDILHPRELL